MRASMALITVLALLATAAAAPAQTSRPSIPKCALGNGDALLRTFYTGALARAERRFGGTRAERRVFSAAAAAYVYGLPPVAVRQTVQRFPGNQIVSIGALVDPAVRTVVFPNVDTTYTVGRLTPGAGPLVIDVPDAGGRYYVIQLLDAYSNTFAYIGRRTTGTRAGSYALVPRGYTGPLPAGVRRIESPTKLVWLLGRTLVKNEADLPAATQVMSGYRVTGLASWAAGSRQAPLALAAFPPSPPVRIPDGREFYDALAVALAESPPPDADACALRAFAAAGVGPGRVPGPQADAVLSAAARAGRRIVRGAEALENRISRARNNGWLIPRGYVGSYGRNWLGRAFVALVALGANTPPETVYPVAITDSRGRSLSGRHSYTVRFERGELPPVGAFWSLTMYRADLYLFDHPSRSYSVGDRTPGLRRGRDGSLTIHIQRRPPRGAPRANWLPAPPGRFRLGMRLYEPHRRVLRGRWLPPEVVRLPPRKRKLRIAGIRRRDRLRVGVRGLSGIGLGEPQARARLRH
jgi:hypothetical protein